jgi:hypothetical protein
MKREALGVRGYVLGCAVAALVTAQVAFGQEGETDIVPSPAAQPSDWTFRFTPGAWLPRVVGDVTLGPGGTQLDLQDDLDLDDMDANFTGAFTMGRGDFQLRFDAFDFSTDGTTTFAGDATFGPLTLAPGDAINSSFDMTSVGLELGYWAWRPCRCGELMSNGQPSNVDLFFGPSVGIRYIDVDQSVLQNGVNNVDTGGEWAAITGGIMLSLVYDVHEIWPLIRTFEIGAAANVGPAIGGDGGFVYGIRAGISLFFTQNIGFTFGYQISGVNVEDGEYELIAAPQGLFIGGTITF